MQQENIQQRKQTKLVFYTHKTLIFHFPQFILKGFEANHTVLTAIE